MIGIVMVVAIVGALSAGMSAGLALWGRSLSRRLRVMIAALLSSFLPLSIALVAVVSEGVGMIAVVSVLFLIVALAIVVGLPVALVMTRSERHREPLGQMFE